MAFGIANQSGPQGGQLTLSLGSVKAVLKTITGDNSYGQNAETLTAAQLGLSGILYAPPMLMINAAGALALAVNPKVAADRKSITFQAYRYDGAAAGKASLEEAGAALDVSTFAGTAFIIGW